MLIAKAIYKEDGTLLESQIPNIVVGDKDAVRLNVSFYEDYENSKLLDLSQYVVEAVFERPDGKVSPALILSIDLENVHMKYLLLYDWLTEIAGIGKLTIRLKKDSTVKATGLLSLTIQEGNLPADVVITPPQYNQLLESIVAEENARKQADSVLTEYIDQNDKEINDNILVIESGLRTEIMGVDGKVDTNRQEVIDIYHELKGENVRLQQEVNQHVEDIYTSLDYQNNLLDNLDNNKLNKDLSNTTIKNSFTLDDYVLINAEGVSYRITVGQLQDLISQKTDYFKGQYSSLEHLQSTHPSGEGGDYAYVDTQFTNEDGSIYYQFVMYVYDVEDQRWEETKSTQYVGETTFQAFQESLLNGTFEIGAIKGNISLSGNELILNSIEINGVKYKIEKAFTPLVIGSKLLKGQALTKDIVENEHAVSDIYKFKRVLNGADNGYYTVQFNKDVEGQFNYIFTNTSGSSQNAFNTATLNVIGDYWEVVEITTVEGYRFGSFSDTGKKIKELEQKAYELEQNIDDVSKGTSNAIADLEDRISKTSTTVKCSHYGEITGNTNDEHGLAIEDQQMIIKKIEGQTLIANNMVSFDAVERTTINGVTFTVNKEAGTVLVNGTPTDTSTNAEIQFTISGTVGGATGTKNFYKNHKYLISAGCLFSGDTTDTYFGSDSYYIFRDYGRGGIISSIEQNVLYNNLVISIKPGFTANNLLFKPQLIDLTLMFGYGNEPTLEEWNAMNFPLFPYSEGYILNSKANLVSTSKNVCPRGEWLNKKTIFPFYNQIADIEDKRLFNCKIPIVYGVPYYYWDNSDNFDSWQAHYFDKNDVYLGSDDLGAVQSSMPLPNSAYMKITTWSSNFNSNVIPTEYNVTAFERITEPLPYQESNLYINEELGKFEYIDNHTNTKHSRLKSIDLGTLDFTYTTDPEYFYSTVSSIISDIKILNYGYNSYNEIKCSKYATVSQHDVYAKTVDKAISVSKLEDGLINISINDTEYTDVNSLKSALQGVMLYYESTEEVITPLANPLPDGMPVWKNGQQLQVGQLPYTLTKEYSLSLGSQVLANIQIDKEQQEQINEQQEQINELKRDTKVVDKEFKPFQVDDVIKSGTVLSKDNINNLLDYSKDYSFTYADGTIIVIWYQSDDENFHVQFPTDDGSPYETQIVTSYTFSADATVSLIEENGTSLLGTWTEKQLTAQEVYDNSKPKLVATITGTPKNSSYEFQSDGSVIITDTDIEFNLLNNHKYLLRFGVVDDLFYANDLEIYPNFSGFRNEVNRMVKIYDSYSETENIFDLYVSTNLAHFQREMLEKICPPDELTLYVELYQLD